MSTRAAITTVLYPLVNTVIVGFGLIIVLSVSVLAAHAMYLVPAVIVLGMILSVPVSWILAPRMRARLRWENR